MKASEFAIEKANRDLPELRKGPQQRPIYFVAAAGYEGLLDYWRILLRHKMAVACFALAGLLAAIVISLMHTPVYRARTSIEIQDFNENFLDLQSVEPTNSNGNFATAQSYFETQIKILQSESLIERVINKLNLTEAPPPKPRWPRIRRIFGATTSINRPDREALVHQAEGNLTVRVVGNSRLLEVLYDSQDPKLAAEFANILVGEFIRQSQETRWKSVQNTGEWLTSDLDQMKAKLEQSEARLQEYARTSGLTLTSEKENVAEIRLKELQEELSKAEADRVNKESNFEEAKSTPPESLSEVLNDPTLGEYRLRLIDLQRQLAELNETLTPAHFKVQRVQAQIEQVQFALQKEAKLIVSRMANEYAVARRREQFVARAYAEQQKIAADQSSKAIHYDTLKRDVDSSRQLYEAMLQRVKQTQIATTMTVSNGFVVDSAKTPSFPYKPNLRMNSAFGLLTGLMLGVGFVILWERIDRRIHVPGDVHVYLNLPELGVLPMHQVGPSWRIPMRLHQRHSNLRLLSGGESESAVDDCPELATWNSRRSLLAECAHTALTSILLPGQNGDHPRVVVFTSPCPGDGKTTVASNLSIAMADIGRKVVLIDGDLRRPRLHQVFGIANSRGLSDVLCEDTPLEMVPVLDLVCETKVLGLYLMPGGSGSGVAPSNLLHSARLARLLSRLKNDFDMVMVDAPPLLHLADARVLGRRADGVILVFRAGQTTTESALFASQLFAEDGTRLLGTILNSWDPRSTRRYGYGSYGYGQAYGEQ
jgi:polysaccharide biosynthesis transport protein